MTIFRRDPVDKLDDEFAIAHFHVLRLLSDEQKAKFNTMGPPPKATSSPPQRQGGGQ
jgi:hypothetical protein